MRGTAARALILAPLLAGAVSCAPNRMSTADIYREWTEPAMICTSPADEARYDQMRHRFDALAPWLRSHIGQAEISAIQREREDEMASVNFGAAQCPSNALQSRRLARMRMLLRELESRERRSRR